MLKMKNYTFIVSNFSRFTKFIELTSICLFCFCCNSQKTKSESEVALSMVSKLNWGSRTIDFGNVTQDTVIKAAFNLYNHDTIPLIIHYVNPECGCTDYSIKSNIVKPNDSTQIILLLDTKDKQGYQRIITTVCTNSKEKFSKLTLKGYVIANK